MKQSLLLTISLKMFTTYIISTRSEGSSTNVFEIRIWHEVLMGKFSGFFDENKFIKNWASDTSKCKKKLRRFPALIVVAAIFKNASFSLSSLKVIKLSKFEHHLSKIIFRLKD